MISRRALILPYHGVRPVIGDDVFLAPGSILIGDVILAEETSIWYQTVVRADVNFIRIGRRTNIQDGSVVHVTNQTHPVRIGEGVTVGHAAIIHGATLEDGCFIGMRALIMDGARIGPGAMVAAGSLVPPDMEIPPRVLAMGSPARVKRSLTQEEIQGIAQSASRYVEYAREHTAELMAGEGGSLSPPDGTGRGR